MQALTDALQLNPPVCLYRRFMAYREAKVYHDGSHYIAIPHTTRPSKPRYTPFEERVEVKDNTSSKGKEKEQKNSTASNEGVPFEQENVISDDVEDTTVNDEENIEKARNETPRFATRKEIFDEAYMESLDLPKRERKKFLISKMLPYFPDYDKARLFVDANVQRKLRNLICRRIRLVRKANLQEFNYFCTFTYDSKKHTEDSFKQKLRDTFANFSKRKDWEYLGVWERSPEKKRLHFHGLFYIPEGTIPGKMIQINDYNFNTKRRQITNQSIYFNERFGRSDFEPLYDLRGKGEALSYIMKYMEKSGERIVCSKGLRQFFISDIMENDVVCNIGSEETKLLLYDDFCCFDRGVYVGQVSSDVIKQLRKAN